MGRYYSDQTLRDVESRVDIVDIIAETVKLTRKGDRYWGLCPFHQEKTPSFSVTPEKNMFYCFGCNSGGDIFSFVMKRDGVDFKAAVEILAAKAGISLISSTSKGLDKRRKVVEINQAAAIYYNETLMHSKARNAQEYLHKRNIKMETIKEFQLGFAEDNWTGLGNHLLKKGFPEDQVKLAGLIKRSEYKNSYYDLFRNRIMFPIIHYNGDVIGFGGRVLNDDMPKYLNTPETEIFSKRKTLYGLYQARDSIRNANEIILVEGYLDCIRLHQEDIKNVVASLGTAFTREQAQLLRRYAEEIVILYDGDEAGQRETLRAIDILITEGFKIHVTTLPDGKDPDEYLDSAEKEEFLQYIKNNKINHLEFKLNRYINTEKGLNLESKIRIINSLRSDIKLVESELRRDYYIKLLARRLRIEENLIYRELNTPKPYKEGSKRNKIQIVRDNIKYGKYSPEEKILAAMISNKQIFLRVKQEIGISFFSNSGYRELAELYDSAISAGNDNGNDIQNLVHFASRKGLGDSLSKIIMLAEENFQFTDYEINEFINRVKLLKMKSMWQSLYKNLKTLENQGNFESLLNHILDLDTFLNNTRKGGKK